MTVLKDALETAGIRVRLNKRVWLWLKDHPGKTAKEIALALHEDTKAVSTRLTQMEQRHMVQSKHAHHKGTSYRGIKEYTALGNTFEVLPIATTPLRVQPYKIHDLVIIPTQKERNIDDLTIAEARALYEQLKRMFT